MQIGLAESSSAKGTSCHSVITGSTICIRVCPVYLVDSKVPGLLKKLRRMLGESKILCFWFVVVCVAGFDLRTRDLYFTILVEVFTNHVLAENTYFANHIE